MSNQIIDHQSSYQAFWDRVSGGLFRIFGPAQLGDPAEAPPKPLPAAGACPRCGRLLGDHTYVQTPERTRMRCPDPQD